jgi:ankyrin repeat protein
MIFIGTTPKDHPEQSSLNNRRTPHGQDAPDTLYESILPACDAVPHPYDSGFFSESEDTQSEKGDNADDLPMLLVEAATRLRLGRNDIDSDPMTFGHKLLSLAVERWDEVSLRMVLTRANIDPNSKSACGQPPLVAAADMGNEVAVRLLLGRRDINLNSKDDRGRTALWCAARNGNRNVVRVLLDRKDIGPGAGEDVGSRSLLTLAAWHGYEELVRLLNQPNDDNMTPLMVAARRGHEAVVSQLVAEDNVRTDLRGGPSGWTALTFAAHNGHEGIVRLLLARDTADVGKALLFAAFRGHEAVVRLLLEQQDISVESREEAVRGGYEKVKSCLVRFLLNYYFLYS